MEGDWGLALVISTRLSVREGRKFGFTVGFAFIGLAGLAWWRDRGLVAQASFVTAILLVFAAVLVPTRLGGVQRAWMRLAWLISIVTTPIFLRIMYFFVITPVGILMRVLGQNRVVSIRERDTLWIARSPRSDLRRQF
jgi:Mg2+/Co2+ transporter CorB